jgi:hypothetical protein
MREPLVGEESDDAEGTVRRVLGAVARCQPLTELCAIRARCVKGRLNL